MIPAPCYVVISDEFCCRPPGGWLAYHERIEGEPLATKTFPLVHETPLVYQAASLHGAIVRAAEFRRAGHTGVRIARLVFEAQETP